MPNVNIKRDTVLIRPRISEKALIMTDKSRVYTFEVLEGANKKSIAASVKEFYGVTPLRVRIAKIPEKKVHLRGGRKGSKMGIKSGGKKAYVYLKQGDKIEVV